MTVLALLEKIQTGEWMAGASRHIQRTCLTRIVYHPYPVTRLQLS